MHSETDQRRGYGGAAFGVVVIALMSYLTFAALQGDHGLFRLFQIEAQEAQLREDLARLETERAVIADKTRRLSGETLDLDLLDEQARRVLGLGRADEIIIR